MVWVESIRNLLSGRRGIDRLSIDDLKHEKIRLEQMERRIGKEIDGLEARKHELFLKGRDGASSRQRVAFARTIKALDCSSRARDQQLRFFHKHLRTIDGLLQIKENIALLKELKLGSVISGMSVEELAGYVETATVQGQFEIEKFTSLLDSLDGAVETAPQPIPDSDVVAIVEAMEQARAAEDAGNESGVAEAVTSVEELLNVRNNRPSELAQ